MGLRTHEQFTVVDRTEHRAVGICSNAEGEMGRNTGPPGQLGPITMERTRDKVGELDLDA